jgi:hypothetical protein
MLLSSWLFIREQESGPTASPSSSPAPGSRRAHLFFPNDDALEAFQVATAERLTRAGWFLWGFDEERRKRDERPAAHINFNRKSKRDRRTTFALARE